MDIGNLVNCKYPYHVVIDVRIPLALQALFGPSGEKNRREGMLGMSGYPLLCKPFSDVTPPACRSVAAL